jgi:hypothetical protein
VALTNRAVWSESAQAALKEFEEAKTHHDPFVTKLERLYRSYRGVIETNSQAMRWTHRITPPYINHIVETTLASLVDERLKFRVRPRKKLFNPGEFKVSQEGASALEILLDFQMQADRFSEKQRWFVLQNMIAGITAAKVYWKQSQKLQKKWVDENELVRDPATGQPLGFIPTQSITEELDTVFDGPCVEVCNVADFIWDPHATSLENSRVVCHRVWKTYAECMEQQKAGYWKNVSELSESRDQSAERHDWSWPDDMPRPEGDRRIEVIEVWRKDEKGMHVTVFGNRKVVLMEAKNPFWHGQFPFVVCATQSDLFRMQGMSQVEKIAHLQDALWSVTNQRLDNLELINNAIVMYNDQMVDDPDDLTFGPRERWPLQGPVNEAVQMWAPNPVPAQISMPAEMSIKQDIQNLAGGFPFTTTDEARTSGANTATEAALVSSLAQRSVSQTKMQLNYAYARMGQQMIELNQQFITDETVVVAIGVDDEYEETTIYPQMLRAAYDFDISPMNESLMRQERRAEKQALYQLAVSSAGAHAMMAQQGMGKALNLDAFMEDVLDNHDVHDKERYFLSAAPPAAPPGPGGGQPPGGAGPPQGITGPQSADVTSPSNSMSMSPAMAQQRFMAGQGGG